MTCCDVCGTEWDPRTQEHRRGIDCASGLAAAIAGVTSQLKKALKHVQDLHDAYKEEQDHTIEAFRQVTKHHQQLLERFEALAKRVNLIEHPELRKNPGFKKVTDDDKKA